MKSAEGEYEWDQGAIEHWNGEEFADEWLHIMEDPQVWGMDPDEVMEWLSLGAHAEDAHAWYFARFDLESATQWIKAGLGPEDAWTAHRLEKLAGEVGDSCHPLEWLRAGHCAEDIDVFLRARISLSEAPATGPTEAIRFLAAMGGAE